MDKIIWSKISIEPFLPPIHLKKYCKTEHFFVSYAAGEDPKEKIFQMIREISKNRLLQSYDGEELSIPSLQHFLQIHGFQTFIEDETIDGVLETALRFHFEHIYRIVSVEEASSCEACRLQEPGQLPHMQEGGCVYPSSGSE